MVATTQVRIFVVANYGVDFKKTEIRGLPPVPTGLVLSLFHSVQCFLSPEDLFGRRVLKWNEVD
jgi:hypothetical protein